MSSEAAIRAVTARAYTIPTDAPEADGAFAWRATTLVVATIEAGGREGLGYTYSAREAATLAEDTLGALLKGYDVFDIPLCHRLMVNAVRNIGRSGVAATAISALDAALWDVKAKLLDRPLAALLARACRSTAAAASPPTTTASSPNNSEAGSSATAAARSR